MLKNNLLSLPAIIPLNLATRIDSTTDYESLLINSFPGIFSELGNLGEPYEVKLKADANPHAIYSPRSIPLPLRSKVQAKLNGMESLGVISKVKQN